MTHQTARVMILRRRDTEVIDRGKGMIRDDQRSGEGPQYLKVNDLVDRARRQGRRCG
jgi:hypothetical protein